MWYRCDCGAIDCPGCDGHPDAGEKVRTNCPDCGRIHYRERNFHGEVSRERRCRSCVSAYWGPSMDPRDRTPDPPAILDVPSVRRMRAMVKDAAENGDREWPYGRTA